jgi:DNA modification methylase
MLMVTDPPYGVEYDASWRAKQFGGKRASGKVLNDDRVDWQAAYELSRAQVAYVWHSGLFGGEVARGLVDAGFTVRSQIIWVKQRFLLSRGDYHWGHEPCWYAVRKGATGKFVGGRAQSTRWADIPALLPAKDALYASRIDADTVYCFPASCSTIWEFCTDDMVEGGHSTQKPLECMARPIRNHGVAGDVVYEPFAGTGTTMVAAQNLERICLAVELNPPYCAVILERMSKAFEGIEIERMFKSDEAAG